MPSQPLWLYQGEVSVYLYTNSFCFTVRTRSIFRILPGLIVFNFVVVVLLPHLRLLLDFTELGLLLSHLSFDQLVKGGLSVPLLGIGHLECVANDQVQLLCLQKSNAKEIDVRPGRHDWGGLKVFQRDTHSSNSRVEVSVPAVCNNTISRLL